MENFADESLPDDVREKVAKMLERMEQMSDEEKEQFQKGIFNKLTKSFYALTSNSILPTWLVPYQSLMLFIFAASMVALLLVMFTRKLYKGTKERENRKAEKRRLKEQKKASKKRN